MPNKTKDALHQSHKELFALHRLAHHVSASLAVDEVISRAIQEIVRVVSPDISFFYLREGNSLILKDICHKSKKPGPILPEVKEVGVCLCGLAAREGKPFYSVDIHTDPLCTLNECRQAGIRSFAALPLFRREGILGVLSLASFKKRDFSNERAFLEILVSHISIALQNALLYQRIQKQAEELEKQMLERNKAVEALQKSEEQYRTMIETMNEGLSVVDQNGITTFVNHQFCEMTGYHQDELLGYHETVLLDKDNQRRLKIQEAVRKRGSATPYEITLTRKDDKKIYTLVAPSPLFDEHGKFRGSLGIFTNITELKQIEEKLLSHQERLHALVLELTLVEERQRRRIATEVQDHIGQTLAFCKFRLEKLQGSPSLGDLKESLDEIHTCIDQVVQYSQSLRFKLSTPILYEEGLESALKWLGDQFQKQYGLVFHFKDDQKPKPMLDETRILLYQSVRELMMNIIEHAQARNVKVFVNRDYKNIRISV
ncbi:MAG: PAS domain S-box protein, partial [Nitrospira sp.]|nr:PAS domain S-box protein [Nitrospira sp.]